MSTEQEVQGFRDFLTEQLAKSGDLSPEQCLDMWRVTHPSEEQAAEDQAAVYASIDDFRRGERRRPAGQTTRELRAELGVQTEE